MPSLAAVHARDASRFDVRGFDVEAFKLTASDAGRIEADVNATNMTIETRDVGRVLLKGTPLKGKEGAVLLKPNAGKGNPSSSSPVGMLQSDGTVSVT